MQKNSKGFTASEWGEIKHPAVPLNLQKTKNNSVHYVSYIRKVK